MCPEVGGRCPYFFRISNYLTIRDNFINIM